MSGNRSATEVVIAGRLRRDNFVDTRGVLPKVPQWKWRDRCKEFCSNNGEYKITLQRYKKRRASDGNTSDDAEPTTSGSSKNSKFELSPDITKVVPVMELALNMDHLSICVEGTSSDLAESNPKVSNKRNSNNSASNVVQQSSGEGTGGTGTSVKRAKCAF